MTFHYSLPFEKLLNPAPAPNNSITQTRVLIVGSGYGGSVAALQLAGPAPAGKSLPHNVMVLERGREYALGEFPNLLEDLPLHLQMRGTDPDDSNGNQGALFDIRAGENVYAVVGSGLGGTSLINANVAIRPELDSFRKDPWPKALRTDEARRELDEAFSAVTHWLGVSTDAQVTAYPKFGSLSRFARALGIEAQPAPLAVTMRNRTNAAGIEQPACTGCGNCVSGCNVGSKNTLAMNLIPAAQARGAEFYTGASVYAIEPLRENDGSARWRVYVQPTDLLTRARFPEPPPYDKDHKDQPYHLGRQFIDADIVILSAGTFGSTEILQRSHELKLLNCSSKLGKHFSTNGDGLSMSYGEATRVNAVGDPDYLSPASPAGPTITAIARRAKSLRKPAYLLEEGAIPAPLLELLGELITTAAQFGRLGWNKLPAWFHGRNADPLAVQRPALDHSQVFLIMSDDGAEGELEFKGDPHRSTAGGGVVPTWPREPRKKKPDRVNETLRSINDTLAKHDRGTGLDGGQYVNSPLWQTMPKGASGMQGKFPGGRMITVHPLGGCRMANDMRDGVVNHDGAVFDPASGATYPGLFVLDGAIIPGALGHNPFLTIAALAWRASGKIAGASVKQSVVARPPRKRTLEPPAPPVPADEQIIVREQLVGALQASEADKQLILGALPQAERCFEYDGLILRVETDPGATGIALSGVGGARVFLKLYANPETPKHARDWHTYGVQASRLNDKYLIATGTGSLTLMEAMPPKDDDELLERRNLAIDEYQRRRDRKGRFKFIRDHLGLVKDKPPSGVPLYGFARGYLAAGEMQCTYRRFSYRLALDAGEQPIEITGDKVISWRLNEPAMWQAMSHLKLEFSFPRLKARAEAHTYVDLDYVTGDGLLTVASNKNTPRAMFNCFAYLARLARSSGQVGFWEFGAPTYPARPIVQAPVPPLRIGNSSRETFAIEIDARKKEIGGKQLKLPLDLHRYGRGAPRGPALLVHGLAQGSLIYAHPALPCSMAQYLLEQGYEVWLLDYRLSNIFPKPTPAKSPANDSRDSAKDPRAIAYDGWAIDEIGALDMPAAIDKVFTLSGEKKVHVFAHCVGAVGMTMAILNNATISGKPLAECIASVAFNAIHPWVMPSPFNKVRAKLGVAFRDYIGDEYLNPIVETKDLIDSTQSLLDRVGFSVARIDEPPDHHTLDNDDLFNAICDRMTFLYGRMWEHRNVENIHSHWADLVGRAPGAVYRHLHHMIMTERVVNREGDDVYITAKNLANWRGIRTLFMHGEISLVFNPQSATRSAIHLRQHLAANGGAATPVMLRRIPNYGHMDPILAGSAATRSFQYLDHFFRGDFDQDGKYQVPNGPLLVMDEIRDDDDPATASLNQARCGPVLRAARVADGKLILRHWLELPPDDDANGIDLKAILEPRPDDTKLIDPGPDDVPASYKWIDATYEPAQWPKFPPAWMRRLPGVGKANQSKTTDCHFIAASCWYPGMPFDADRHDQTFAGIATFVESNEPCDALFLLGDQIYADATNGMLESSAWIDRYVSRYRRAFTGPRARKVLARIPTHFTIDDHEIANDFAGTVGGPPGVAPGTLMPGTERIERMKTGDIDAKQLDTACKWARTYVEAGRHAHPFGKSGAESRALWYALDDGELACPAFLMDTRSGRSRADAEGAPARMLAVDPPTGRAQLEALLEWLRGLAGDDRPKLVFTGSVIAPIKIGSNQHELWMREDGFLGYPQELERIVRHIVDHDIRRVVFVAGDLHLSAIAKLTLENTTTGRKVEAAQIVASALYAPLPFVNTSLDDIDWKNTTRLALGDHAISYQPTLLTDAPAHFIKVAVKPDRDSWRISATPYDAQGSALGSGEEIEL